MSRRAIYKLFEELGALKKERDQLQRDLEKYRPAKVALRQGGAFAVAVGGFAGAPFTGGLSAWCGAAGIGYAMWDLYEAAVTPGQIRKQLAEIEHRIWLKEHTLRQILGK